MAVLRDFECAAHGSFESFDEAPRCPHGCSAGFVRMVFLKPVGLKSNGTKVADQALRAMAADYGMTNIGSNGGESVRDYLRRGQSMDPNTKKMNFSPLWQDVPHAAPGFSQAKDARVPVVDPSAALGGSTVQGENAVSASWGESGLPAPRPLIDPKLVYRPAEMPSAPE